MSHPRLLYALLISGHAVGFFCNYSHAIVFRIKCPLWSDLGFNYAKKTQSLDWLIFYVQALVKQLFLDSKSARVSCTPHTWPRPGKLNGGLSTVGHGSSGSVSQCGRKGGGLSDMWALFGVRKKWNLKQFCDWKKNGCFTFDIANVIIGVHVKIRKGFNWECRDTFPIRLMTPSHHSLEN